MIREAALVDGFCRIYSLLLYAYPAEFRREYGAPMKQLLRDRCRDLAAAPGIARLVRFAVAVASDWVRTAVRERAAEVWSAGRSPVVKRGFVAEWACTILIYLFANTTLVQAYVVPTGSMEGNLLVGDHLLVDRLAYADPGPLGRSILPYRDVERGDIIAFLYPEDVRQVYVKRVIGLPGDRIRLEHGQVIRNGRRLIEPYVQHLGRPPDPYRDDFPRAPEWFTKPLGRDMLERHVQGGELVVPPGMLFALGDNRENSDDSRYWGFVPRRNVIGKPLLVYWSYDAPTEDLQEWTFNHVIDVAQHFFTRTRWNRTLLVPRSQKAGETGAAR